MYLYHANALALGVGGVSHGVCALPITGGTASPHSSTFEKTFEQDGVSCKVLESKVSGKENGNSTYITSASVILENLKITARGVNGKLLDLLSADLVEAKITSKHKENEPEARIDTSASRFVKLRIGGRSVGPPQMAHDVFRTYDTYTSLEAAFKAGEDEVRNLVLGGNVGLPPNPPHDLHAAYDAFQKTMKEWYPPVVCSLVKDIEGPGSKAPGIQKQGPIIILPNARIYLGELVVWPWMRCLNMFRVEVDSGMRISGATVGTNGTTYPPGYGGGTGNP